MRRILIADDDPAIRSLLQIMCRRAGFQTDLASDGVEALEKLQANHYVVALVDLMMPRMSGYDLIPAIGDLPRRPAVLVVTAMHDTFLPRMDDQVVHSIIRKPFDIETVGALITEVAQTFAARRGGRDDGDLHDPGPDGGSA